VHVLCIVPSEVNLASMISISSGYGGGENVESAYQQLLRDSIEKLKARGVTAQGYLAQGDAIDEIAKCAERLSIDLIVLGDYPRAVGGRWWAGSQSRTLADRTRCSILIAR
jgi:nucleotide-binding universal stress UspA family protein